MKFTRVFMVAGVLLTTAAWSQAETINLDQLQWSVQYMIDQSQTVCGIDQFNRPRDNRGLALSPDNQYLYAGYNNPSGGYCVRKIDLSEPDYNDATLVHLGGDISRGKAIATDDAGRVYLAEGANVMIYDADLSTCQYTITVTGGKLEGVAAVRQGGQLVLYGSNRNDGNLTRYTLTESGGDVTGHSVDTAWASSGQIALSTDLRGVEVDSGGKIWVADQDSNAVYVVAPDGLSYGTISVNCPIDVGIDGATALVTRYTDCLISRFDTSTLLSAGSDLSAPLTDLELTADPETGDDGGLSGIAVIPGVGFYLTGEGINTANEHSTYGRVDGESGYIGEKFYTDLTHDDNEPIFFVVPEPATWMLVLLGLVSWLGATALLRKNEG